MFELRIEFRYVTVWYYDYIVSHFNGITRCSWKIPLRTFYFLGKQGDLRNYLRTGVPFGPLLRRSVPRGPPCRLSENPYLCTLQ